MPPPANDQGVAKPAAPDVTSHMADHLPISRARDLLDWLEVHGIAPEEVRIEDDGTMSVRWSSLTDGLQIRPAIE
jgi:hypothetical protein